MEEVQKLHIKKANTFGKRLVGLMFKRSLHKKGLLLSPCNSVHMFFMRFPIDVVFVNRDGYIVLCIRKLKPWRVSPIVKESYYVLELPAGSIDQYKLLVGDKIAIPENREDFFITTKHENNKNHLHVL